MKTYNYKINQKIVVWQELTFSVDAKNKKEANKLAKEVTTNYDSCDRGNVDINYKMIYETEHIMEPKENEGYSTTELYCENNKLIYKNGK